MNIHKMIRCISECELFIDAKLIVAPALRMSVVDAIHLLRINREATLALVKAAVDKRARERIVKVPPTIIKDIGKYES